MPVMMQATDVARSGLRWLRQGRRLFVIRWIVGILSVVVGLPTAFFTFAFGHCATLGGECPAPPGRRGDIYGGLAVGAALTFVIPVLMWRPDRVGVKVAVAVTASVVVPFTLVVGAAAVYGWG